MRKIILALAALAAFSATAASAQLVIARSQSGAIGTTVSATDPSGNTGRAVLPGATLYDSTGVEKGTVGNPLSTRGAGTIGTPDSGVQTVQGTTANSGVGNPAPVIIGMRSSTSGGVASADLMNNGMDLAGSTILAVGNVAQCDDTSPQLQTENRFGAVRMSCSNHALIVKPFESAENGWAYAAAASGITNTTTAVTIKASAGAGVRNYLTGCTVDHDTLGAVTELVIRDGAAGTVILRRKLQTTATEGTFVRFDMPLRGSAATLMEVATLTAVTGGVYVNCQGYAAP